MKQTSQSTGQPQHISTVQGKKKKRKIALNSDHTQTPTSSFLLSSLLCVLQEWNTSWKLKRSSQQSIYEKKKKSPSSKPYPEYGAGAYLVLESPWKHPSCVTQVSRAGAASYCIICMANQPQVLSAPSRSSAGSLEKPFNNPKRNTIPTPSLSQTFTQIVCLQTNPALK